MVNVLSLIDNIGDFRQLISQDSQDNYPSINVAGDYINSDYINKSRNQNITNSTISDSGAGAFSLGDISGTVADTINQLPNFDDEPNKKELKKLLTQMQNLVLEENLDNEDKEDTLVQIQAIAEALQNNQNRKIKRKAKSAMGIIQEIVDVLPPNAAMVTICNQIPNLIARIF